MGKMQLSDLLADGTGRNAELAPVAAVKELQIDFVQTHQQRKQSLFQIAQGRAIKMASLQTGLDLGAAAHITADVEIAPADLGCGLEQGNPQPDLLEAFGGKKRVLDFFQGLLVHAPAVVGHFQGQDVLVFRFHDVQAYIPGARGHGILHQVDQVETDVFNHTYTKASKYKGFWFLLICKRDAALARFCFNIASV
jgi:hypothetical protein